MLTINTWKTFFEATGADFTAAAGFDFDLQINISGLTDLAGTWTPRSVTSTQVVMVQDDKTITIEGLNLPPISSFADFEALIAGLTGNTDLSAVVFRDTDLSELLRIDFLDNAPQGVVLQAGTKTLALEGAAIDSIDDLLSAMEALRVLYPTTFNFLNGTATTSLTRVEALTVINDLDLRVIVMSDDGTLAFETRIEAEVITITSQDYVVTVTGDVASADLGSVYGFLERLEQDLISMVADDVPLPLSVDYATFDIHAIEVAKGTDVLFSIGDPASDQVITDLTPEGYLWNMGLSAGDDVFTFADDPDWRDPVQVSGGTGSDLFNVDMAVVDAANAARVIAGDAPLDLMISGDAPGASQDTLNLMAADASTVSFLQTDYGTASDMMVDGQVAFRAAALDRINLDTGADFTWDTGDEASTLAVTHAASITYRGGGAEDVLDLSGFETRDTFGAVLATGLTFQDFVDQGWFFQETTPGIFNLDAGWITLEGVETVTLTDASYDLGALEGDAASGSTILTDSLGNTGATTAQTLNGGGGDDYVNGGAGDDFLDGGSGDDRIVGAAGSDTLWGGDGADILNGGDGDDFIFGGDTDADLRDIIYAGAGNDQINGGYGNDLIFAMDGDDVVEGGFGADEIQGQNGSDVLSGSALSDLLFGNDGADFINGGFGGDRVNGGSGADTFYHLGIADHGSDWIQDFSAQEGDLLLVGRAGATEADFQVNYAHTQDGLGTFAGDAGIREAFVIYRPTGQVLYALVDGEAETEIMMRVAGSVDPFDLI